MKWSTERYTIFCHIGRALSTLASMSNTSSMKWNISFCLHLFGGNTGTHFIVPSTEFYKFSRFERAVGTYVIVKLYKAMIFSKGGAMIIFNLCCCNNYMSEYPDHRWTSTSPGNQKEGEKKTHQILLFLSIEKYEGRHVCSHEQREEKKDRKRSWGR